MESLKGEQRELRGESKPRKKGIGVASIYSRIVW